ncbi:L-iditol 2-dehydrogenase [Diaporthe amygdali]|uniref:L-iditol 2-dehydrogenase n=1 Tax=Phomopsis amygdali TaxID=1214568 RepID=UPI0022FE69A7|nr:L-iditol 2-dehydrogenase [Diaporthe amygdali]KAJ0108809.1 L-iditol 2-dehydrogenase [Diaporthe amygdali]
MGNAEATSSDNIQAQVSLRIGPPESEEVPIEMKATTLCGSDVHYYTHFRNGDIQIKEPLSQGHESAGLVIAVGPEVASKHDIKVGDIVALEAGVPCDKCEVCLDGDYNVCEKMRFRSSATAFPHFQGTLRERFNHPAKWVHNSESGFKARRNMSGDWGWCGRPSLCCCSQMRRVQCAGYNRVVMADIASNRLAFAKENGFADDTVNLVSKRPNSIEKGLAFAKKDAADLVAMNQGDRFARTFECTGVEGCATRGGGKVLLIGMGTHQTLPMSAASLREVDLVGVWRYANCYPQGIELMEKCTKDRSIPDLRGLTTHSYKGLSMVPEAFSWLEGQARRSVQANRLLQHTTVMRGSWAA